MSFWRVVGNILWLFLGGLEAAINWLVIGLVLCLTIIGIPFGLQCFKIATFVAWPFGSEAVRKKSGLGRTLLNILWAVTFGLILAISHIIIGIVWMVTIIGIPFGLQHFKMVEISIAPFGMEIIEKKTTKRKTTKKKTTKRKKK